MENRIHTPVMLEEAITALSIQTGGSYVDGTAGGGGHLAAILDRVGESGQVLGIDRDPDALERLEKRFGARPNLILRQANFSEADQVLADLGWEAVDGMLLDLGLSSHQLEISGRGFSFDRDEPLDMRMNPDEKRTAFDLVNHLPEKELADLIYRLGEERGSRRVARSIVWTRKNKPIETSAELASAVRKALYRPGARPRLDNATRTFQALRLAVNRELESLEEFLAKAPSLIRPGGRLVVISFHSLEDRLVKTAMKAGKSASTDRPAFRQLDKKPIRPSEAEEATNPRSRSAKLRAGERV